MKGVDFADYIYESVGILTNKEWYRHFIIIKFDKENSYSICLNTNQMKELKKALNEEFDL